MPETLVWNLAFPASDLFQVRRIFIDLEADPHVQNVSWQTAEDNPHIIEVAVEFRLGHYQPERHELRGLNLRYPATNPPARPMGSPLAELHRPPPPVLSNGFKVGEWARRKHHAAVYKVTAVKGSDAAPLVVLTHVESKETISISIPHLLVGYEPLTRPPNIPTWHDVILDEDPFG